MTALPTIRLVSILAATALATAGCFGGEAQGRPGTGGEAPTAIPVAASRVARTDLTRDVILTGPVEPLRLVGVNSRSAGTVLSVRVVEGDRVRPGQLMAELDARETAAQLERAKALAGTAEAAFRRAEQLRAADLIAEAEFETARAGYLTARSDVELWQTRLAFSRIEAPGAGVVLRKYVEAGSAVSPDQRMFDVADDSLLVVRVRMSELDVVRVRAGDSVRVQLDAYPGETLRGWVRRVFPSADPETRLVPVEVALRDRNKVAIRPGFLARARFALERRPGVLAVPAAAVGASPIGPFVYVVQADTLVRRNIRTGLAAEGRVEVLAGLDAGDLVVTSGQMSLREGAPVRVTQNDRPAAAQAADSQAASPLGAAGDE